MPDPLIQSFDPLRPERGWQAAVPLPYWRRPWWRAFRLTPSCYPCDMRPFRSRDRYEAHWRSVHQPKETTR